VVTSVRTLLLSYLFSYGFNAEIDIVEVRKEFIQALSLFISLLSHNQTISARLDLLQKQHSLIHIPKKNALQNEGMDAAAALQLESTVDLQQVNTRAGLYIFLNSLVSDIVEFVLCLI